MIPLLLDVTKHDSNVNAAKAIKKIEKDRSLSLIGVVHNAGISRLMPLENEKLDDIRAVMETNLFGVIDLTQQLLEQLRASKGRIVMISSLAGKIVRPMSGAYSASKFALEAISDALRRELGHMGISVSVVQPAYVKTPIFEKVRASLRDQEDRRPSKHYERFTGKAAMEKTKGMLLKASHPSVVTDVIEHALTSPHPAARYPCANFGGIPAWLLLLILPFVPDRVLDWYILRV